MPLLPVSTPGAVSLSPPHGKSQATPKLGNVCVGVSLLSKCSTSSSLKRYTNILRDSGIKRSLVASVHPLRPERTRQTVWRRRLLKIELAWLSKSAKCLLFVEKAVAPAAVSRPSPGFILIFLFSRFYLLLIRETSCVSILNITLSFNYMN